MTPRLALHGLSMSFGALQVTRNVSLVLEPGSRTALIGPNGAGKTTLVNLIGGIWRSSAGRIELDGQDITTIGQAERVRRGIVRTFQINRLFADLTVAQNIRVSALQRHRAGSRLRMPRELAVTVEAEVEMQLVALGLERLAGRTVKTLALGEQRLVEIALALVQQPRVLLLDEPAAGVPRDESRAILDTVDGLPADLAVLLIEHDMDIVFRFARRIVVLVAGVVLVEGEPEEIARDPRVRETYFGRGHGS